MRDAARNFVAADDTLTVSVELRITHTTNWGLCAPAVQRTRHCCARSAHAC
jgi:hypothetical protein